MRGGQFALGAAFGAILAIGAMWAALPPIPRLIGHECVGTGGDIWAMEESDFPMCYMIERNR